MNCSKKESEPPPRLDERETVYMYLVRCETDPPWKFVDSRFIYFP